MGFENGSAAVLKSAMPISGNRANGSNAVTGTGIASVDHHAAIRIPTAATYQAS